MGFQSGQSGTQQLQPPVFPLGQVPPGTPPRAVLKVQPLEEDGDDDDYTSYASHYYSMLHLTSSCRSPKTKIVVEGSPHTFILDTGAEVSIVPRDFLANTNAVNQTVTSHTVKAFGRGDVLIEGPYYLNTEICGVRFVHPYYVSSKDPLYVAGYDLITKAKLVIDSSNRCVWSYYTSTPQGMPTCCSSSSAIDASIHCFTTTAINSILHDTC